MAKKAKSKNRATRKRPTQARLKKLFSYDQETGILSWLSPPKQKWRIGKRAGWFDEYWRVLVDGMKLRASNVIWKYTTGKWPPVTIDHKNLKKYDDRWVNLRLATRSQNSANLKARSKTGIKGTSLTKNGRYSVTIRHRTKQYYLGRFDSKVEAKAAYLKKAIELFGEFARAE